MDESWGITLHQCPRDPVKSGADLIPRCHGSFACDHWLAELCSTLSGIVMFNHWLVELCSTTGWQSYVEPLAGRVVLTVFWNYWEVLLKHYIPPETLVINNGYTDLLLKWGAACNTSDQSCFRKTERQSIAASILFPKLLSRDPLKQHIAGNRFTTLQDTLQDTLDCWQRSLTTAKILALVHRWLNYWKIKLLFL